MASNQNQNLSHKAGELTGQAQTSEQVRNMAQGAADAVKNTLGMNNPNDPSNQNNTPSNPSTRI
ncbi:hypothetical protein C1H46_017411 [Malus baccata]|uniref:Uncharacterized protein n=1 Tax=Malus baccata TaxID=106549 RepID=A0A540MDX4_MALBA|nr:hypothetical protein C1H46_017411 [Malus baccata]